MEEEALSEKAKLICDQFLISPIPPRCRINATSSQVASVVENINIGMHSRSLFHDLTINIFPLLLNYWQIFCERRHQYVPRAVLHQCRRDQILNRRKIGPRKKSNFRNNGTIWSKRTNGTLVNYCASDRFTDSRIDITKSLGKITTILFNNEYLYQFQTIRRV